MIYPYTSDFFHTVKKTKTYIKEKCIFCAKILLSCTSATCDLFRSLETKRKIKSQSDKSKTLRNCEKMLNEQYLLSKKKKKLNSQKTKECFKKFVKLPNIEKKNIDRVEPSSHIRTLFLSLYSTSQML